MEIPFTPEQEAQITEGALLSGKEPEQLVRDAALRSVQDQEAEFLAAVEQGIADADAGNFVDHEDVWAMVQKALKS